MGVASRLDRRCRLLPVGRACKAVTSGLLSYFVSRPNSGATSEQPAPFTYDGGRVDTGETQQLRDAVSEPYLGDPVRIPVTIINGPRPGPTVFLSAAIHGDELNGIEVVCEVAQEWNHTDICGTIVCLPVANVQGFTAQERYLPIYERDLNRAFPGKQNSTSSNRIAHSIYHNFIAPCDFGLDFHTSTRGRTSMFHVRADMDDENAARLARAFGTNLIIVTGLLVGVLENPVVYPGNPLCHFITLEEMQERIIENRRGIPHG